MGTKGQLNNVNLHNPSTWVKGLAVAAGAVVVLPLISSTTAHAATMNAWDRIAACESGDQNIVGSGRWNISYGDADSTGGLQIQLRTWNAYGGQKYASAPYLATKAQQIEIAEKILASEGSGAWVCNQSGHGVASGALGSGTSQSYLKGGPNPFGTAGTPSPAPLLPDPAPSASPVASAKALLAVNYAKSHISSASYLWGGEGPNRFDCSGLTMMAWQAAGVNIPHNSTEQLNYSPRVSLANIRPGDLVVYSFGSYADHVAIYTGPIGPNGSDLIDTASRHPGGGVNWSKMSTRGGSIAGIVRPAPYTGGSSTPVGAPLTEDSTYTVHRGDSLWKIANSHHIQGGWQKLYSLNKDKIHNPNYIDVGWTLRLA